MRANDMMGLVRRLLTQEADENQASENLIEAPERVLDKLRMHLSRRLGPEGFRTLLARALTLTTPQYPFLITVRVEADGSLVGLSEATAPGSQETIEGAVALVAHLLALLVTFIGEDLTRRILSTVWPELTLDDANGWENDNS